MHVNATAQPDGFLACPRWCTITDPDHAVHIRFSGRAGQVLVQAVLGTDRHGFPWPDPKLMIRNRGIRFMVPCQSALAMADFFTRIGCADVASLIEHAAQEVAS